MKQKNRQPIGQNLVELVIVLPFIILLILAMLQFGLYWRTFQTVESVALQGAKIASSSMDDPSTPANEIKDLVIDEVNTQLSNAGLPTVGSGSVAIVSPSSEPFGFYSSPNVTSPEDIQLILDYRDPIVNGITVQLAYGYKPLLGGAKFSLPGAPSVEIIPAFIIVSSSQIQQYQRF